MTIHDQSRIWMIAVACASLLLAQAAIADDAADWPQMRGPTGDGLAATGAKPPTHWSETEGVSWKTPIQGEGWSTPVVSGNFIWLTTATEEGRSRRAVCVNRQTGKILHDKELFRVEKPAGKHDFNSYASPSPAANSEHVYITFGADGTACLDRKTGTVIWQRSNLVVDHYRGAGSSPVPYNDMLLLHYDGIDKQFIVALEAKTGKTRWQTTRSHIISKDGDFKKAYSTPLVRTLDGRDEVLSIAAECVYGYAPTSGKELWRCRFSGFSNAVLPLVWQNKILVNTGFGKAKMFAVRSGGNGDITDTHMGWEVSRNVPRMSSPIIVGDDVYMVSDNATLTVINPKDGSDRWHQRLGGGLSFTASPILANGNLYFFDHKKGSAFVVKPGKTPEIIAKNKLNDGCMASPIAVGNELIVRSKKHLYLLKEASK